MMHSSENVKLTRDEIAEWCQQQVANLLNIPVSAVDPEADFDKMGLDSVVAVSLLIEIEERFGVELPPEALFENPNLNSVTAYLHSRLQQPEAK